MTLSGFFDDTGDFLGGFIHEFGRNFVWIAALLGGIEFLQPGMAQSAGDLVGQCIFGLGVFGISIAALTLPARDLAEGWLGMISGNQPKAFDLPGENLGRATCGLACAAGWAALLIDIPPKSQVGVFLVSFSALAMLIFGVGLAVPRIWFAIHAVPMPAKDASELLAEAGNRARIFFACAFAGIGLSFPAVKVGGFLNPAALPVALQANVDAGSSQHHLCRNATARCPRKRLLHLYRPINGPVHITLFAAPGATVPCRVRPIGAWATPQLRHEMNGLLNGFRGMRELTVAPHQGQATLEFSVPPGHDRCWYKAKLRAPSTARWWESARIAKQALCRTPTPGCPSGIQIGLIVPHGPFDIDADGAGSDACRVEVVGDWASRRVRNQLDARLNSEPGLRAVMGFRGHDPMFRFELPDGRDRCKVDAMLDPSMRAAPGRTPEAAPARKPEPEP